MISAALEVEHGVTEDSLCDAPPLLTLIVPAYNAAATIEELVQRALDAAPAQRSKSSWSTTGPRMGRGNSRTLRLAEIADGTSCTVLAGEITATQCLLRRNQGWADEYVH